MTMIQKAESTLLTRIEPVHVIKVQVVNTIVTTQNVQLTLVHNYNSTANQHSIKTELLNILCLFHKIKYHSN